MYLFYFTLFGTFFPYIARFLTSQGLTEREASLVVAVVNGVNIFAPFLFSYLADRSGRRMVFIRTGYVAIGLFYLAALFGQGFWYFFCVFGLFGIFLSAVLPQMESVTLSVLGKEKSRYGQIRMWGSIGFVAIVWIIGFLLDVFSVRIIAYIGVALSGLMFAASFLVPERKKEKDISKTKISNVAVEPIEAEPVPWGQVCVLLSVIVLWQFGMAPYNTFFDLYLSGHGFSGATNGFLISFGSLCEIGIFIYVVQLFRRYSERALMCFGLIATVIRWLLLYWYADSFFIVLFSQTLHAMTFGVIHAVVVHRIGRLFPESRASFGQGLYVAFGAGLGLFFGNIMAGILWDGSGIIYLQGAGWTFLALLITWFGFKEPKEKSAEA
jgi:PPP family 3-phenylpropionic acid transporter